MRGAAASALLVLALAVGACSGDGDGDGGGDDDGAAGRSTTTTELRFTGDPGSPFCEVLREYGGGDVLAEPSETAADTEAAFTELLDVLGRVAEAAPPELVEDTALFVEGVSAFDAALRRFGYSYTALEASAAGPEVAAAVNDPAFRIAGERIEAYKDQVCGL